MTTRKQRKFVETVELQIGLRDYDPDKRFNGTVRLPHKISNNLKVSFLAFRFASSLTLHISKRQLLEESPTSTLKDSRLSTRIRQRLKNGPRNTTFFWPATQLLSKPPSFSETYWSRWTFSPSPSPKERKSLPRLRNWSTPSNSSPRRLPAWVPLLETSRLERTTSVKTSQWALTFSSHSWKRDGKTLEPSTSRLRWEDHTESSDDCIPHLNYP